MVTGLIINFVLFSQEPRQALQNFLTPYAAHLKHMANNPESDRDLMFTQIETEIYQGFGAAVMNNLEATLQQTGSY